MQINIEVLSINRINKSTITKKYFYSSPVTIFFTFINFVLLRRFKEKILKENSLRKVTKEKTCMKIH